MKSFFTFKHYANAGDLIACLAGIKSVCEKNKTKAVIYQQLDVQGQYYTGATHPVRNSENQMVMMNQEIFDMMRPLLTSQPYIHDLIRFEGQKVAVDIDDIRLKYFVNIPNGMIQSWPMLAFPDMAADLSQPWIDVEPFPGFNDMVVINLTERYRSRDVHYYFLKDYPLDRIAFSGTRGEYELFCDKWGIELGSMYYIESKDFLSLARIIKGAKFFLGNQSMHWNLANAMGVPRILEMCHFAPNCQPFVGPDNYGFYHQGALEYYFDELIKR